MDRQIPDYIGRFKVKKALTRKLNYKDWLVYRDPEYGIYLYSPSLDIEVNPLIWNISSDGWSDKVRNMLLDDIRKVEEREAERLEWARK